MSVITIDKQKGGVTEVSPTAVAKLGLIRFDKGVGAEVIDLEKLNAEDRRTIVGFYHRIDQKLEKFGKAALEVGEELLAAREWLKPRGLWMAFLKRLPGMSPKTADRFINRSQMARKKLPEAVLAVAQAAGINLAGESEKEPFGRYTRTVKRLGGPPKTTGNVEHDMEAARGWVGKVVTAHNRATTAARKKVGGDPVEGVAARLVAQVQRYAKEEASQVQFLAKVLTRATQLLGYKKYLEKKGRDTVTLHLVAA